MIDREIKDILISFGHLHKIWEDLSLLTDSEAGRSSAMIEGEEGRDGRRERVVNVSRPDER